MASIVVRTALLLNTTSRLTRDTPIDKPPVPDSNSKRISDVATNTLATLPKQDHRASSQGKAKSELHYYKQLDKTNRQLQELSRAFRARL